MKHFIIRINGMEFRQDNEMGYVMGQLVKFCTKKAAIAKARELKKTLGTSSCIVHQRD